MDFALSVNGVPIRLTEERWNHIVTNHDEMSGRRDDVLSAVAKPSWIVRGHGGSLIAYRSLGRTGYLSVIYKEVSFGDGFVITAYVVRRPLRKNRIWPPKH